MDNRAIGIFDSGLGGLTSVKELWELLPNESVIYFGDTSRVPYGTRSKEIIKKYAVQDINLLLSHNIKAIVVACGTVSSVVLDELSSSINIPILGVVKPTCYNAVRTTKNKKIGVLGTAATIKSGAYKDTILKMDKDISVYSVACPMFVPLVENGYTGKNNEVTKLIAKEYLEQLIKENVDTIILGCTHYPLLSDVISDIMGNDVTLINSGKSAITLLKQCLIENNISANKKALEDSFFVSDSIESFSTQAQNFLGVNINKNVEMVDIDSYSSYL